MNDMDLICLWIAELAPLVATLFSLIYGLKHFFKKREAALLTKLHDGNGKPYSRQYLSPVSNTHKRYDCRWLYACVSWTYWLFPFCSDGKLRTT